jgi:hypothetical protein
MRTSSSGTSKRLDIDNPAPTVTHMGSVSQPIGEWWLTPTSNSNIPMPDLNNLVIDPDEQVLNTSRNNFDDEE